MGAEAELRIPAGELTGEPTQPAERPERDERPVALEPGDVAGAGRGDAEHDRVRTLLRLAARAQVVAQSGAGAVGRSLEDERDIGVARRRRGERPGQRDRHRGTAAVVVGRGHDVGARHVEQRGQREHEPGGGQQLDEADPGSVGAAEPEQRHDLKPGEPDRGPAEPAGGEVARQAARAGGRPPWRVAVHQAAAARVVVGGDDEPDARWGSARRGAVGRGGRGGEDVLAGALRRQAPTERDAEHRVGDDRDERDQDEQAADLGRGDREQASHQPEPDVPGVGEGRVRPAPEGLDVGVTRAGCEQLVTQPAGGTTLGV